MGGCMSAPLDPQVVWDQVESVSRVWNEKRRQREAEQKRQAAQKQAREEREQKQRAILKAKAEEAEWSLGLDYVLYGEGEVGPETTDFLADGVLACHEPIFF